VPSMTPVAKLVKSASVFCRGGLSFGVATKAAMAFSVGGAGVVAATGSVEDAAVDAVGVGASNVHIVPLKHTSLPCSSPSPLLPEAAMPELAKPPVQSGQGIAS